MKRTGKLIIYPFPILKQPHGNFCIVQKKFKKFLSLNFLAKTIYERLLPLFTQLYFIANRYPIKGREGKQNFGLISQIFFALPCLGQLPGTLLQCVATFYRLCCNKIKITIIVELICIQLKMHISTWTFFLITPLPEFSCFVSDPGLNSAKVWSY